MFGYVRPDLATLTEEAKARYRSFYCGLCRALGQRHGQLSRLTLTFDLTYLTIFLSSLYEPEEKSGETRCLPHPVKPHEWRATSVTNYAADMTIALTYHKCRDDWADDRSLPAKAMEALLRRHYADVKARWPRQCAAIESAMEEQSAIEARRDETPDAAPACFGRLMSALFVMEEDFWAPALSAFGDSLGRYIYLLDAVCDSEKDAKKGGYNPVLLMEKQPEEMRGTLEMLLGRAAVAFERLPLVQDEALLRNILYSGLWQGYDDCLRRRAQKKNKQDKESEVDGHGE